MGQHDNFYGRAIFFGLFAGLVGFFFVLVSLGLIPPWEIVHGPMWMLFCVGFVFILAAALLVLRGIAGDPAREGELPADAPRSLHLIQNLFGLTILVCMAVIGSWIAFGPGERSFTASGTFVAEGRVGQTVGRVAFGIGAVVMWLCVVVVVVDGARRLMRRS
jgi:hypothetical protein